MRTALTQKILLESPFLLPPSGTRPMEMQSSYREGPLGQHSALWSGPVFLGPSLELQQRRQFFSPVVGVLLTLGQSAKGLACLTSPLVSLTGSPEVFLPPDPIFASAMSENDNVFCAQLQCFHFPTLRHHDLHSWHAESCSEKSSFLCKRSKSPGQPPVGANLMVL